MGGCKLVNHIDYEMDKVPLITCPILLYEIITILFSQHQEATFPVVSICAKDIPSVTKSEVLDAMKKVAPSVDEIDN